MKSEGRSRPTHESLRTNLLVVNDEIVQKINPKISDFKIDVLVSDEKLVNQIVKEFIRPFNIETDALFRVEVIDTENNYYLLMDMHHIITDGISGNILLSDLVVLYNGKEINEPILSYKDYANWQSIILESEEIESQKRFWMEMYQDSVTPLELPYDYIRPMIQSFKGNSLSFKLDKKISSEIKKQVRENNTTLFMYMLASINVFLYKISGSKDIVIGTPVAGRNQSELNNVVGMFVNTLPIRSQINIDQVFDEYVKTIKEVTLKAYENQEYQLEMLLDDLKLGREMSRNPLFDVVFVLQNIEKEDGMSIDFGSQQFMNTHEISKFDLSISSAELNDEILINFEYNTELFKEETVKSFFRYYENILLDILKDPKKEIKEYSIISKEDQRKLINKSKRPELSYDKKLLIQDLIHQAVEAYPDRISVFGEDKSITYKELDDRSNQIARLLKENGVERNKVVAVSSKKTVDFIVRILGIMKAGGAYLPIDQTLPEERIQYMIVNSKACLFLYDSKDTYTKFKNIKYLNVEEKEYKLQSKERISSTNDAEDDMYILYTSGSTGEPKGVEVTHRSVHNYIKSFNELFETPLGSQDNCLSTTKTTFDVSVGEIFPALCSGSKLVLYTDDYLEIDKLVEVIINQKITYTYISPTLLKMVAEKLLKVKDACNLQKMLVGVEAIMYSTLALYQELNSNIEIVNGYGPTEATICASFYMYNKEDKEFGNKKVPIGKSVHNTELYICNDNRQMQPDGFIGELYIGGDGLARGYLNNPKLTEEKFVENPFKPGSKMYATGDYVKRLETGDLEFIGRKDNQVKVRGFRVELGEISSALYKLDEVKENEILIRTDESGTSYLCAYIVSDEELDMKMIKDKLSKALPDYMVPSAYVRIEELPLTSNGKIDRRKLLSYDLEQIGKKEYVEAKTETEKKLVEIWKEVLNIDTIGIHDNFFDIGGHSLKAIGMLSKVSDQFSKKLSMTDFMNESTIDELKLMIEISEKVNKDVYSEIVLLKKDIDSKSNIYFVCDITGSSAYSFELIKKMNIASNIYGINYLKIKNSLPENIEMEEIATKYINGIIANNKQNNKISLIGWSFGGVLAYNIAIKLKEIGFEKVNVILIDSPIIGELSKINIEKSLFNLADENLIKDNLVSYFENVEITKDDFLDFLNRNLDNELYLKLKTVYGYISIYLEERTYNIHELISQINIIRTLKKSLKSQMFIVNKEINVCYIKASNTSSESIINIKKLLNTKNLKEYTIEGSHFSLINNNELIMKLNNILSDVND